MKTFIVGVILASLFGLAGCSKTPQQSASVGPSGGDLAPIKGGSAYAELLANADTGEMMVHTWDKDLKTRRPVDREPITVGSGENSAELLPHPMDGDPSGMSSRFYGHAGWARGRNIGHGWLTMHGDGNHRHSFDWQGGKAHGKMWEEMGEHRRMGPAGPMEPGHKGGGMDR